MLTKEQLLGKWLSESDTSGINAQVIMLEFGNDNTLTYTIHSRNKKEIILLTYRIDGDYLVTDQPSEPREEKTRATLRGKRLCFNYEGQLTYYLKQP